MRKADCPHCFRLVFVNDGAICPACKGNVDDKSADHEDLTPMEFVDGEELPPACVACGSATTHRVVVGEKNEPDKYSAAGIASRLLAAFAGIITIPNKTRGYQKEYRISVALPVCGNHRQSRALVPLHIDYRRYRITLPVHPAFIQSWKKR